MAMSVNPAIEGNQPLSSGQCDPAEMIGPRSTVPIRARGHVVPQQQAAHMTATGRPCTHVKTLASRGPSTHDSKGGRLAGVGSLRGAAGDEAISMQKGQSAGVAMTAKASPGAVGETRCGACVLGLTRDP